jgi:hypothetical protein
MKKELDERLCADYPLIFRDRHGAVTTTAMCWGFECGDGWYNLINTLCSWLMSPVKSIERDIKYLRDRLAAPSCKSTVGDVEAAQTRLLELEDKLEKAKKAVPVAVQVKEKFGTLCFYVSRASDKEYEIIHFVEYMSGFVCEVCGAPGRLFTRGWYSTKCEAHKPVNEATEEDFYITEGMDKDETGANTDSTERENAGCTEGPGNEQTGTSSKAIQPQPTIFHIQH